MEEGELVEMLVGMMEDWQVDELIDFIRSRSDAMWVVIGRDPMEGKVGEAPPDWTWNLN